MNVDNTSPGLTVYLGILGTYLLNTETLSPCCELKKILCQYMCRALEGEQRGVRKGTL